MDLRYFVATFVFLACTERASSMDTIVSIPSVIQYQLLSIHSGRFVGVTTDGGIHAMGDIRDPGTVFVPRLTFGGKWAFESFCNQGKFIVLERVMPEENATEAENSTKEAQVHMHLGVPINDSELFEQISPFPLSFAYKASSIEPEMCFMAFDAFGNNYNGKLCDLNTGHVATHLRYIESLEPTQCDHTQLKTSKTEL